MLDKTVPFFRVILKRPAHAPIPEAQLPQGFSIRLFVTGDELDWAEIETSVGEFPRAVEALQYFQKNYIPFLPELSRRTFFIVAPTGEKVGTFTCWWMYTEKRRDPWMHWVAVKPAYQGLGLGKALVFYCMKEFIAIEGDRDIYLPTQTWSYKAIGIYRQAGFDYCFEPGIGGCDNQTEMALSILRDMMH